jgi:energy-coupling factor transporter ATP-binding protein EcfA2
MAESFATSSRAAPIQADSVVSIENLRYWYPDEGRPALDGINLSQERSELTLVIGPSGCGKSTLMLALNGTVPKITGGKIAGQVQVAGMDPLEHEQAEMATKVGIVFQDPDAQLASIFVRDEVAFGLQNLLYERATILERIDQALAFVGLHSMADRDVFSLSGGEKQRLAIASILAMQPELMVLDEPTANIDPQGGYEVTQVIKDLRDRLGMSLVVVEHEISNLAPLADRLVVMNEGQIAFEGPPRDVLQAHGRLMRDELGLWIPEAAEFALELEGSPRTIRPFPLAPSEIPSAKTIPLGTWRPKAKPTPGDTIVRAENVTYTYARQPEPALRSVNCSIRAGEAVALLGQNGSGKSTFASLLVGLRKPGSGLLEVDGHDAREAGVGTLARTVSYVFQYPEHQFVGESVFDDAAYGLRRRGVGDAEVRERVLSILGRFGLDSLLERHPFTLSMGQKRRLSIADMLVTRPRLLILDEPTSGQDRRNTLALVDLLNSLRDELGLALVVITHDMRLVAEWCDRAIVLSQGETVFEGQPDGLFAYLDSRGEHALGLRSPDGWRIGRPLNAVPVGRNR